MADSNRTPLLRRRSSQAAPNTLSRIFTAHNLAVASGPLATLFTFFFSKYHGFNDGSGDSTRSSKKIGVMLGALLWMALWWMLEPVPIAVTSLLPLVLFPLFEIMDSASVAREYMSDICVLMLGTFILALAIDKYSLHKRMALKILLVLGGESMDPRLVLMAFLAGPAFISMWMSNTSAAAMMIPMATGMLHNLEPEHHVVRTKSSLQMMRDQLAEEGHAKDETGTPSGEITDDEAIEAHAKEVIHKFSQGVVLCVTYGVCLGGLGTLIGTGPNLMLPAMYSERYPNAPEVSFLMWMKFAMPLVLLWIVPLWLYMCWCYSPSRDVHVIEASLNREMIEKSYKALGPVSFAEMFIFAEFCIIVVLWVTRSFGSVPGWGVLFNYFPSDGTVAVAAAILLFVVPNYKDDGEMLMDWKTCKNIGWNVILLLGGGFALSQGISDSGVSTWIGFKMDFFKDVPYYLVTPVLATILSIITEFASNAATATLFIPIFLDVAVSSDFHPLLLAIPATFASSFAFILPSGTPPNAIAFGTGYLKIKDMVSPGLFMHALGIIILSVLTPTLGAWVYGLDQPASSLPWLNA